MAGNLWTKIYKQLFIFTSFFRNSSCGQENLPSLLFREVFWTLKFVMKSYSSGPITFPE